MDTVIRLSREQAGKRLYDVLLSMDIPFLAPCGGRGTCGKCRVKLIEGRVRDEKGAWLLPDENGEVLSCHAVIVEDCAVAIPAFSGSGLSVQESQTPSYGTHFSVALDIGTTTLAAALVDPDSGSVVKTASALNPQSAYGADVMSRITACREGKLSQLQATLLKSVTALMDSLTEGLSGEVDKMTVVGNPTMLHLFLGISPEGIGQYPFTPAFLDTQYRKGRDLMLPCREITVLPSASAFIGSDVMAGVYFVGMQAMDRVSILLDVGTNGEIVLAKNGNLYAASCAAGPALEGARISSGMGGVSGAVSSVKKKDGVYCYTTVGDMPAKGICGAGLCDLIALLLDGGVIDSGGYLDKTYRLVGCHETKQGRACLSPTAVTLTASDIREVQLAKAAIRAGLDTLLKEACLDGGEIDALFLAGGLGFYLSPDSAMRIGMFSESLRSHITAVGNTALQGAIKALCERDAVERMEALCREVKTVELNESEFFAEAFMNAMLFDEL